MDARFDVPVDVDARVDLHMHSTCSDGRQEPAAVIATAKESGLRAVALTDHDTLAGIAEAGRAAQELALEFIPGMELSTYDESGSTHLLGYFVDADNRELSEFLERARASRVQRAREIVEKLNRLGIPIKFDQVAAQASANGLIARPHVARALLAGGWVKSYGAAFDSLIADGQPAYVPTRHCEPFDGIRRIQAAGGLAFLAHGGKSHDEATIRALAEAGLDGLEVLHSDHGPVQVRKLRQLADELGLLESGGSDWHGPYDNRRGNQLAVQPVPYDWYIRLRDAAADRKAGSRATGIQVKSDER